MGVSKESVVKARLSKLLKTRELGKSIYVFNELDSTQDFANSLTKSDSLHGTVVLAGKQNIGKGRMGRNWFSPEGGLWMSLILIPDFSVDNIIFTQFIAALAVADAIFEITNICCKLKWPNDVLINGKKVCGILIDVNVYNETKKIVMGIGLNANNGSSFINNYITSQDLKATTLKEEYGNEVDLLFLVKAILERIEYYYDNFISCGNTSEIIVRWKHKSDMFGKKATVHDGNQKFVGRIFDIDTTGALLIKLGDASIKKIIYYDDVTLH